MSLKRLCIASLLLSLAFAGSAQAGARLYSLGAGSGAQLHIGNGLALPIQSAATVTGMGQPPLLIPRNTAAGTGIVGTTDNTSLQKLSVPTGVLKKAPSQTTVGVYFSNTALYAVGTNLGYDWPAAKAVFSTGIRTSGAAQTTTYATAALGTGLSAVYSPGSLAKAFGGAARFATTGALGSGAFPGIPVTLYLRAGGSPPPCVHTTFGGTDLGCRALMAGAYPAALGAHGGHVGITVTTPGTPALSRWGKLSVGTVPSGTILMGPNTSAGPPFTNMATSYALPWTGGKIQIAAASAAPPEAFTLSGTDLRTSKGAGTIQMVSGSLSARNATGPNANRGWLRLDLVDPKGVPSMAPWMRGVAVGILMLTTLGYYGMRRRQHAA